MKTRIVSLQSPVSLNQLKDGIRLSAACLMLLAGGVPALAQSAPVTGQNVNMVSGVTLADGDPFLTKQNESTIAVSSVNPLHLLAGANDYRLVPLSQLPVVPGEGAGADSWIGLFKSVDGGKSWHSTVVSGCPLNIPQCNDPKYAAIKGLQYASDPNIRPGPYGSFFYTFIAGNRGTGASGVVAVQRFFDLNNNVKKSDDPFLTDQLNILDIGTATQFKDKPWVVADTPTRDWNDDPQDTCVVPTSKTPVRAFSVYVSYTNFLGSTTVNPQTQILVASSKNCGKTFGKPHVVSTSQPTNQGTVLTVDPQNGTVYVFWRQINTATNGAPDAIYVSRSTNGGDSWSSPIKVATITPFEQETGAGMFRAEAFPTAAVSVLNGISRVHVAWSERGVGPGGAARIVMSTSRDGGHTWPAPVAVDNNFQNQTVNYSAGPTTPTWASFNPYNTAGYGHQFQPALTFAAGKLTLIWQDQRLDHTVGTLQCPPASTPHSIRDCNEVRLPKTSNSGATDPLTKVFTTDITDATPGLLFRHTLDVFGGQAVPADTPVFTTTRISKYLYGSSTAGSDPNAPRPTRTIRQIRFNVPNVPIFANGTLPFIGDYNDVAAQQIIPTGDPHKPYDWNVAASNTTVFHGTWTTNQDVVPPKNGNWASFTPVKALSADGTAILQNASCQPGQEATQNQNIYTATLFNGVDAYAVLNSKYLSNSVPRQFNVVVQNGTAQYITIQLAIAPPPTGTVAGFKINGNAVVLPTAPLTVNIGPFSSATRTIWVTSSNAAASVTVNVNNSSGGPITTVVLNPDPNVTLATAIPPPPSGDVINNNQGDVSVRYNDLSNNDLSNNDLSNRALSANDLSNNDLSNNDLSNNDLSNAAITVNDLSNNDLSNNDLSNNDLSNNDLSNNDLSNNDLSNNDLSNAGLTDSTFTLFNNSSTTDVALDVKALLRGQTIPAGYKVQLIVHKTYTTQVAASCGFAKIDQHVTVVNAPHPTITTIADLSNPNVTSNWVDNSDPSNSTIALMPQEIGRVTFRLVKTDGTRPDNQAASTELGTNGVKTVAVTQATTIVPVPVAITTLSLPDGTAGQSYSQQLTASGGLAPITWTIIGGSLPPAINLSTGGLLSGTPTTAGVYTFTVRVGDSSTPNQQTDTQTLTLTIHGIQTVAIPATATYRTPVNLAATSNAGQAVSYSVLSGGCSVSGTVLTATSGTGSCSVQATAPANAIYFALNVTNTVTLSPVTLTVTADNKQMTYGGPLPALTASYSGFVGTDSAASLTGSPALTTTATTTSGVGTYPITPAAGTLASPNYKFAFVNGTLTIGQAVVKVTADNKAMTYGGAVPALTASYSGFLGTDTAAVLTGAPALTTTASSTSNAGSYPITAAAGTLAAANYSFTFVNGTLTVNQAVLKVTADNKTMTYGATLPALTASYSGFVNSETAAVVTGSAALSTAGSATSNAGSYPITAAIGSLTATNYSFTFVNGTLTINPALLTVTSDNKTMTYGGTVPALTASYTGFVNSDTSAVLTGTPALSTTGASTSNIGSYPITASAGSLTAANYTFTFVAGTLTISPAPLTVTPANATRTYGAANPTFTGTITGVISTDTITANYATTAVASSAIGPYPITVTLVDPGAKLGNYTVTLNTGTLTITPAVLTVTPANATRTYGAANPAFTGTITGVIATDTITANYATTAVASSAIGPYPITATLVDPGAKLGNYTVTLNTGTLTITQAVLTVTPANASRTYGAANPAFTGTITGVIATDTITANYATTAGASSAIGPYPITATLVDPGAKLGNYSVTLNTGTLTITQAALTVTPANASRTYGVANPAFTGTITGVIAGDNITANYSTTAVASSAIGPYPITATLVDPGAKLANYTVTLNTGTLTVGQAALTVTPNNATRIYGAANPAFTGTITGVIAGDSITANYSTTAGATSGVGGYPITAALVDPGAKLGNYIVTVNSGTLTVTQAALTISAAPASKIYGNPLPAFTPVYAGFVGSDGPSVLTGTLTYATAATATSPAGTYPVTPGGVTAANYAITFNAGTLTVTKATPVFSGLSSPSIKKGATPTTLAGLISFTPTAGGAVFPTGSVNVTVNGVSQTGAISATGTFSVPFVTAGLAAGTYTITYSYAGDSNFGAAANGTGTLTVTQVDE